MSRTLAMLLLVVMAGQSAYPAPKKRPTPRRAVDDVVTVRELGERIEKVWLDKIQPDIDNGHHPAGVNTATINIIWSDGRHLAKSFEITRQTIIDRGAGLIPGVLYLIRHADTQYVGLVKTNDRWRSFSLSLQGDLLSGNSNTPAPPARIQTLLATFVTDPNKVGVYFAPWFRKISLPGI